MMFGELFKFQVRTWVVVAYLIATDEAAFSPVVLNCIAVGTGIEVDAEGTVVGGVWGDAGLRDVVVADGGTWLVAQRIDAARVVELAGIVAYLIIYNVVVLHSSMFRSPPPANTDATIVNVTDGIVSDEDILDVAAADGHSPPVLVGDVVDGVVLNDES